MKASDALKIKCLCEFRDFLEECNKLPKSQIYAEAARAMGMNVSTLRDSMSIVRDWEVEKLHYWIIDNGMSFRHIELAGQLRPNNPEELLIQAMTLGNGDGKVMSCDEMVAFALGGKKGRGFGGQFTKWLNGFRKFRSHLSFEKQVRFDELTTELKGLFDE